MPELPEVEAVARALRPMVTGRRIRRCRVLHAIAARPHRPRELAAKAGQQRILGVERMGKYLVLRLEKGCLVLHFRLDGQLVWFDGGGEFQRKANRGREGVHVDVALELGDGVLGFVDRRHFGRVQWWPASEACPGLSALGLDPLSADFTQERFAALLKASRRPLKSFLLDQKRIAGLGNIYSAESLWHARLDPRRKANRVQPAEAWRLHKAVVKVLRAALECCSNPAPDFRKADWWFQGLEKILRVYGREGQACRRCQGKIARIEQGGRSTFFCRRCQR